MSYPITDEALSLFSNSERQVVDITFNGVNETITLTEKDIPLNGLSVNRYCASGDKIEIGSAVAAELTLTLDNSDGRFDDVTFEGAELYVRVGTKKWNAKRWENARYHYIPFGYFTVDEVPRKLSSISLTALDRMVVFDKAVNNNKISFPLTVAELLNRVCEICGVTLNTDATTLTNAYYEIKKAPTDEDLTYRQYIAWIAEITGTCAFIDWNGQLVLKWYEQTDTEITLKNRYSSDLQENSVTISGVQVVIDDETYLAGTDDYIFSIESNSLIQHSYLAVAEGLNNKLNGFTYTPFTANVKPMPHLYPLDIITFVDKNNVSHQTIVTECTFTLNGSTELAGKGETQTKSGYATLNPLTAREKAIVDKMVRDQVSAREQSVLALNEVICNSLGLRVTTLDDGEGGTLYYFHNKDSLAESTVIYTYTSGGFAWTADWNDGEPVWKYGFTQDGNAVFNALSTYKIQTDYLSADCVSIAWNNISKHLQLENGALNIYDVVDDEQQLVSSFDYLGSHFYRDNTYIGKIGTNSWVDNDEYRGLVFDLEYKASYMCWAAEDEKDSEEYTTKLVYHHKNSIENKGLHFYCNTYAHGYKIDGANLTNVRAGGYTTFSGDLPVVSSIEDNGDGTITWVITTHKVVNGLIVS